MCVQASVGKAARNTRDDVKVVQVLLNLNLGRVPGASAVSEDGAIGPNTQRAIEAFQRAVVGVAAPDGVVAPGSDTLAQLRAGIPAGFSDHKLRGIMPSASEVHIARYFPGFEPAMLAYDINTPLRQAHFLSQTGHESGGLVYAEELASGDAYERRANLGNTQPGDGPRFKGRGLIQLTGRANYTDYGTAKQRDFVTGDNPKLLASDPHLAVDVACWFWKRHGLNEVADRDDITAITKTINGGLNGFEDRKAYLTRSRFFLIA